MSSIAIILLILNIIIMLFMYFKLNKKFSDANVISEIRRDAQRLVENIAFQTDKSVTVIEDKIREANFTASELEKRIVLAKVEKNKRIHEADVLNSLAQRTRLETPAEQLETFKENQKVPASTVKKQPTKAQGNLFSEDTTNTKSSSEKKSNSVKIYTKQILLNSKNKALMPKESFHDQIVEMARKGFSSELIAEKVPIPLGEIELIISMNA